MAHSSADKIYVFGDVVKRDMRVIAQSARQSGGRQSRKGRKGMVRSAKAREHKVEPHHIRLQLVDAGAFININTATEAQLQQLPVTQEQIDSLLDWREAGQTPRANGAKDSYYNALEEPYNTKLGPLTTLDELLLIKGWTAQELYTLQTNTVTSQIQPQDIKGNRIPLVGIFTTDSSAPNTRADGSARTNFGVRLNPQAVAQQLRVNAQLALQIANRSPYNSFRALLGMPGITSNTAKTLLDSVRFGGGNTSTGKLNVNTASEEALRSLPNMPADVAASIVSRQSSGIQSLGELSSVPGLTGNTLAQLADSFTVGSNTWIVRVYSVSGGIGVAMEATATITNGTAHIQTWSPLHTIGIPAWWGWEAEPTTTTQLGTGQ